MIYLRAAILTIFVLIVVLVGYMFLTFDTQYELNLAMEEFQKGNYNEAEAELHRLTRAVPKDQLLLYEAYIYRAHHQYAKSNKALDQAEILAKKESQKNLLLEIYLNKIFNAYLLDDTKSFQHVLEEAQRLSPNNQWVRFFSNLDKFCTGQYQEARDRWQKEFPSTTLSGWMKKSFEENFNTTWLALRLARCQIEEKKFVTARQILEEEMQRASPNDMTEINLLLGLSYLKEAEEKPLEAAGPYFKLAFSYFDQVPMQQERFANEKEKISQQVYQVIVASLKDHSYENLPLFFGALEKWKSTAQLKEASAQLVSLMNEEIKAGHWKAVQGMIGMLTRLLSEGEARQSVSDRFTELAQKALQGGDFEHLTQLWEAARLFSSDPEALAQQFENETQAKIMSLIPKEEPSLPLTAAYVTFYETVEKDNKKRLAFADHLVALSVDLWLAEGQEQRAISLMQIASNVPAPYDRKEIQDLMGMVIQRIYVYAAEQDKVEKLPYLLEAIHKLKLSNVNFNDKKAIANYQADARFLFAQKRYFDARRIAEWLVVLDPSDSNSRRILGLSNYYLADYQPAMKNLSELGTLDDEALESLAISRAIVEHTNAAFQLLEQMEKQHAFNSDSYLRLGLGLLTEGQAVEAINWLKKITYPDNEVYAALTYAYFKLGDWSDAVEMYHKLTPPYSEIVGLRGIFILSLGEMDQKDKAEDLLTNLLNEPSENVEDADFSKPFFNFEKSVLDLLDPDTTAVRYYQDIKKDPEMAKKYQKRIRTPEK